MKGPANRLRQLGQLAANVADAAEHTKGPAEVLAHELADWVRCATGIIGELVLDVAVQAPIADGAPASCSGCGGAVVDEAGRPLLVAELRCFDCSVEAAVSQMGHS